MGVISHMLTADASEAERAADLDEPPSGWDGFSYRGLDRVILISLTALVDTGSAYDRFEQRLDEIRTIPAEEGNTWVDIIPTRIVASLASIAAMEEEEQHALAEQWHQTDELKEWEASDVFDLARTIGDTAETAQLENKTLFLWTSM